MSRFLTIFGECSPLSCDTEWVGMVSRKTTKYFPDAKEEKIRMLKEYIETNGSLIHCSEKIPSLIKNMYNLLI